jgi:formate C-acetyltransferase
MAPVAGRGTHGLTAMFNSACKLNLSRASGSSVLNVSLLKSTIDTPEKQRKFIDVLLTYFQNGGYQVQVNVIDKSKLLDAQKHPEKYSDLVVKVGGFSARFIDLNAILQNEIIARDTF